MPTNTVAISEQALRRLAEINEWTGVSREETLERLVGEAHKHAFWDAVNAGYAALRADPQVWAEELAERRLWETTLADGLDP